MAGKQSTKDLVEQSGLSPSYFHPGLKECHRVDARYQYRLRTRLAEPRNCCTIPTNVVERIGHLVGFTNIDQFSKMFKKKMGMTPSVYRRGEPDAKAGDSVGEHPIGHGPAGKKGKIC